MIAKPHRILFGAMVIVLAGATVSLSQQARVAPEGWEPGRVTTAPVDGAPSCDAPTPIGSAPYLDDGNTCGDPNNIDDYNNFGSGGPCNTVDYPGPDVVYSFTIEAGAQLSVTLTPQSPADLGVFVVTDCDNGTSCVGFADQIGGGAVSVVTFSSGDLTAGGYFIWVDSYYTAGSQSCGPYSLFVDGDVPAELIDFSVE